MNVVSQVITLFLLMLCGLVSSKLKLISQDGIAGLNKLVVCFALPCLTIAKLQQTVEPGLVRALVQVFFISGIVMLLCGLLGRFVFFRNESPERRTIFTSVCLFPNVGYMGYPVLTAAFGASNLIYGVLYNAMFNLLCWSVGVVLFDRKALNWRKLLKVPSLVCSVIGIALFALNIRLPKPILDAMNTMGDITTPLAMFIIGYHLSRLRLSDLRDAKLLLACALRLLVFPLTTWAILKLLGFSGMVLSTLTLCTAMPGAAAIAIQSETYGGDTALASRAVALSTLFSIITIPLFMLLL